ncbi:DUF3558 domain-containing protein [Nocardia sp. NBC_00508]|uniref:DUF3558 domain-containing protein n=1 Tax=Nocardia sp. NBC_00508 TaxID=2975992 RepID=UPI002E81FDC0|nr:DUF3558 domain-containing protein [Nocardia sp. NBC_00508]WUD67726.1 DUF3558 domain-containing protein [Nocardia sp. NBC_00508]
MATIAALAGVVLVASGCGSNTNGTATPSTDMSAATAMLWDPCTQVSNSTLQQIGVRADTKRSGVAGVEEPGWKVCSWNNEDFNLGVSTTIHTVDDFKAKPDNIDFSDISIAGRDGVQHRRSSDRFNELCDLVFPASSGSYGVTISNRASSKNPTEPCASARAAAAVLVPSFPH